MKRSNTVSVLNQDSLVVYRQRVAYHEAGHAVGIHFNNGLKNLPPVFYKIIFKDLSCGMGNDLFSERISQRDCVARVKGGRLIQSLPLAYDDVEGQSSAYSDKRLFHFTDEYRLAFEADIVNLLIGPLAEAKYVAQIDAEPFNHQLVTVEALKHYGGDEDLAVVHDYLRSYSADEQVQRESLNRFFIQAYNFINDKANWKAITRLAAYILASNKKLISCEEVAEVIESGSEIISTTLAPDTTTDSLDRDAKIAELAYYKAEARGFEQGYELEDWLTAEQEYSRQIKENVVYMDAFRKQYGRAFS